MPIGLYMSVSLCMYVCMYVSAYKCKCVSVFGHNILRQYPGKLHIIGKNKAEFKIKFHSWPICFSFPEDSIVALWSLFVDK